jgi:hypothetical protein
LFRNALKVTCEHLRFELFSGGYTPGPPLNRGERTRGRKGREGNGAPRFNLVSHTAALGLATALVETSVFETEPSRDLKILETKTCEKRVSGSFEPRREFQGIYITGHTPQTAVESRNTTCNISYRYSAMLQILATSPVTTATGGKNFCALMYPKNYLRSAMIEDRLNGLAHLYLCRDIELARLLNILERVSDAWRLYEPTCIRNKALKLQHY